MNIYDIGDLVRVSVAFTDSSNVPTSPTTVTLSVRDGGDTLTTPAVVADGVGLYHAQVPVVHEGITWYRWGGEGALVVAEEGKFAVRHRQVPSSL